MVTNKSTGFKKEKRNCVGIKRFISLFGVGAGVGVGVVFSKPFFFSKIRFKDIAIGTNKFPGSIGRNDKTNHELPILKKRAIIKQDYDTLRDKSKFFQSVLKAKAGKTEGEIDNMWDTNVAFTQNLLIENNREFPGFICKIDTYDTGDIDHDSARDHFAFIRKCLGDGRLIVTFISHSDNYSFTKLIKGYFNFKGSYSRYKARKISDYDVKKNPEPQYAWEPSTEYEEQDLNRFKITIKINKECEDFYAKNINKFMRINFEFLETGNGTHGVLYTRLSKDPNNNSFSSKLRLLLKQKHLPSNGTTKGSEYDV